MFGIPFDTFRKYVHPDPEKRRVLGKAAGRPSLLTKSNQGFIADALARLDRANDGSDLPGAIDLVQDIDPHLSRTQARQTFSRTIRPNHPNLLKPKTMTAQATTTKRSAITVPQQFRWLRTYNSCLDDLRRRNMGVCNLTGKTFGELIRHFIFGGDETWNMDQLVPSMQHGSTDKPFLSAVVQKDRAFYPSRSVVQDGRTLEHVRSLTVILAWDDCGGEEEYRRYH